MKNLLRQSKLLERLQHQAEEKQRKDKKILTRLKKSSVFQHAQNILLYLPIHGEVDLSALLSNDSHDEDHKKKWVLPKVKDEQTLHLFQVQNLDQVEVGKYKIMEPKTNLKEINPKDIDLVLVPGVVFSPNGHRIGYGKGFYDRLLKKVNCPKVGVAYDFQIVENIPGEPHDTPMDMIITESKTYKIHTL